LHSKFVLFSNIDWKKTKEDVRKFLRIEKVETLDLWSVDFFEKKILKIKLSQRSE
jgi:hypothetical protein